jgi:hypothetical protein
VGVTARSALTIARQCDKRRRRTISPGHCPADRQLRSAAADRAPGPHNKTYRACQPATRRRGICSPTTEHITFTILRYARKCHKDDSGLMVTSDPLIPPAEPIQYSACESLLRCAAWRSVWALGAPNLRLERSW